MLESKEEHSFELSVVFAAFVAVLLLYLVGSEPWRPALEFLHERFCK